MDTPYSTVRVGYGGNTIMASVNKSEIGGAAEFNFGLVTFLPNSSDRSHDAAPDFGMWNYSIAAQGPDIQGVMVQTTPSFGPKAGKTFVIAPVGLKLPPAGSPISVLPQPDTYSCRATIAGRAAAGAGTGGCTLRIPQKARGKRLSVTLTVTYEGATKSVPYTFAVS